jgi:hypothetical protein
MKFNQPFLIATSEDKSPLVKGTLKYVFGSSRILSSISEGLKSFILLSLILSIANLRKSLSAEVKSLLLSQGFTNNKSSPDSSYIFLYNDDI